MNLFNAHKRTSAGEAFAVFLIYFVPMIAFILWVQR